MPHNTALVRQRGAHKASLTKLVNKIQQFDENSGNLGELRAALLAIDRIVLKFEQVQEKILQDIGFLEDEQAKEVELITLEQEDSAFEDVWRDLQARIMCILERRERPSKREVVVDTHPAASTSASSSTGSGTSAEAAQVRYIVRDSFRAPDVQIPTFDGSELAWRTEWALFRDLFNDNVHKDEFLSPAQKFQRLKGLLRGEALALIINTPAADDTYEIAYTTIMEQYNSDDRQIGHHLKLLFGLQALKKSSPGELRSLLVNFKQHVTALRGLDETFRTSDTILRYMLVMRLDKETLRAWETKLINLPKPVKFDTMLDTLMERVKVLQAVEFAHQDEEMDEKSDAKVNRAARPPPPPPVATNRDKDISMRSTELSNSFPASTEPAKCKFCSATDHTGLWQCKQLWRLPLSQVLNKVRALRACFNCMGDGHMAASCPSRSSCRVCGQRHFTQLHEIFTTKSDTSTTSAATSSTVLSTDASWSVEDQAAAAQAGVSGAAAGHESSTLLARGMVATVMIDVRAANGQWMPARGFLDSGSNCSYISERLRQLVQARKKKANLQISGIGGSTSADAYVDIKIRSRCTEYTRDLQCFVLRHVMATLPPDRVSIDVHLLNGHALADPQFFRPSRVDLLLGADLFFEIMRFNEPRVPLTKTLWLQSTEFGQVVVGNDVATGATTQSSVVTSVGVATAGEDLAEVLKRFWTIEERVTEALALTPEEERCEHLFRVTHSRDESGRYIVRLPVQGDPSELGTTRRQAHMQFLALERRLARAAETKEGYVKFMAEYFELGHMERCPHEETDQESSHYYLPHHPVLRPDNLTTKLRVVFNGSSASSTKVSLNELLSKGPKTLWDVFQVLIPFREHPIAFTLDLTKMYRQILVSPDQRYLQSILWRSDSAKPIETFHLATVTYGTKSADYLATRCLKQLVSDDGERFPLAARILDEDCYVDDVCTSQANLALAIDSARQLKDLLLAGQFVSHKWASNCPQLLPTLEEATQGPIERKVLGVLWHLEQDTLRPFVPPFMPKARYTKRNIAAGVPEVYDPLGLIGPVTLRGKVMLQRLWLMPGVDWDTLIDEQSGATWEKFRGEMALLNDLRIARCVRPQDTQRLELHGFCDGSDVGYGACLYLRATDTVGRHFSRLLCSKSRVAPVLKLTTPRIELCGALLLAELVVSVRPLLRDGVDETYLYTDSTIVLAWLHNSPTKMKLFVANRVARILQLTPRAQWRHVTTAENPADPLSRGVDPADLVRNHLWWCGPAFLSADHTDRVANPIEFPPNLPEMKENVLTLASTAATPPFVALPERFSSWIKTLRVAAYAARYCFALLRRVRARTRGVAPELKVVGTNDIGSAICCLSLPTLEELSAAERLLLGLVQRAAFAEELKQLHHQRLVAPRSSIVSLSPFLDEYGLIRVGGRLHNADLAFERRHPLLLPRGHPFSTLLARHLHEKNCHAAPQLLLNTVHQRYWVVHGRSLCRKIVHGCIICKRARPKPYEQLMGSPPSDRVCSMERPFLSVGVDYCGPVFITSRIRGRGPTKAWIAIFVCMATHAIHIEIVGDCSTEEYMAAFHRFCGRRGVPLRVRSDNATTFVGADNYLKELHHLFEDSAFALALAAECTEKAIDWQFIPALSPHMGGMWESAVKSFKLHFRKIVTTESFTLLELSTLVIQVEACLNSRPLSTISSDPNDLRPLTPGHFLIGGPLNALPEPDWTGYKACLLSRWQNVQAKAQLFWRRWSAEVINQMQQRSKWTTQEANAQVGDLVVLVDNNSPPLRWQVGCIAVVHPGRDGLVRAVTVRTSNGEYTRSVAKVCPLLRTLED